ncbi:MAG: hypothetical protein RLY87_902 [Chloroflexota bacterium]|jgi:hypothetical protein
MNRAVVEWLQSDEAQQLCALIDPTQHLHSMSVLRRMTTPERAAAIYELAWVRAHATRKFSAGAELFFTKTALEQASHQRVGMHRALQFAGATRVADICCGCGGDLLSLATVAPCIALDQDDGRIAMAHANMVVRGLADRVSYVCADAQTWDVPADVDAIFFDPGRRVASGRIYDHDAYLPPLSTASAWRRPGRRIAIKCAPGIDYSQLPFAHPYAIECVSLDGDLRETVIWLDGDSAWQHRATVLDAHGTHILDDTHTPGTIPCTQPNAFFIEPDVAVIRAGLVQHLAARLGATMLDPQIAYLTHDRPVMSPFARCWEVLAVLPFSERQLKATLKAHGGGAITVKKRGSPIDTDALAKRLSQPHGTPLVVVLTRVAGAHTAIVCHGPLHPKEPRNGNEAAE